MWVIIYAASMATLLIVCSVWAACLKDHGAEAAFAGTSALLSSLLLAVLCGGAFDAFKGVMLFVVVELLFIDALLGCHALVRAFKQEGEDSGV